MVMHHRLYNGNNSSILLISVYLNRVQLEKIIQVVKEKVNL